MCGDGWAGCRWLPRWGGVGGHRGFGCGGVAPAGFSATIRYTEYGWLATCVEQFGTAPAQILHEWNSVTHVAEFEGQSGRRPLTYEEVQALFDAADGRVDDKRARGRKGALTAMRDSALFKAFYAFGLHRQEMVGLNLTDLRNNPKSPDFGRYGALFVRFGKSSNGCPPKRLTWSECDVCPKNRPG